ncbi:MAG TPA: hypothetical protein VJ937_12915, partial [Salinivirga sp.]|uniref:hypothetical protein n=1 Tax=Salinivirga sp. TaxID=1970192 RepID=UPI002C0A02F0|nr:hypothetical protein [Salinivirga sp.]
TGFATFILFKDHSRFLFPSIPSFAGCKDKANFFRRQLFFQVFLKLFFLAELLSFSSAQNHPISFKYLRFFYQSGCKSRGYIFTFQTFYERILKFFEEKKGVIFDALYM